MPQVSARALRFDGVDLLQASDRQMGQLRGQRLSMIMQDPKYSLNPVMTVGAQIGEAVQRAASIARAECRERVEQLLARVHIREPGRVAQQYPHQLSGGMGQRVMIAMMLAQKPRLLIADEPTSALDVSVRQEVLELLDEMVAEQGLSLLFITHDLNLVGRFCDRVLVMYAGRVVEALAAADLTAGPAPLHPGPAQCGAQPEAAARHAAGAGARCGLGRDMSEAGDAHVVARGLTLALGEGERRRTVLQGVSLDIAPGQAFGLVGESGSGKTTVLRCLAGQYRHWQGQVRIAGEALTGAGQGSRLGAWWARPDLAHARRVQMVFQDPYGSLHPRHTVHTALAEPLRVHRLGDVDDRIDRVLAQVGLPLTFRHRYPHQLSGGQRQRVAIARALILAPGLLLLDEPTSALDVSVQAEVLNLLAELRRQHGLTYLLVSHDLGVVAHLCDRLAVMQHGAIVETLSTDALCAGAATHPYTRTLVASAEA